MRRRVMFAGGRMFVSIAAVFITGATSVLVARAAVVLT